MANLEPSGEPSNPDDLLRELFHRKKKTWEGKIEEEFDINITVITEREEVADYSHKVILKEKDFLNLFRYIRSLKKQIAKLKKQLNKK